MAGTFRHLALITGAAWLVFFVNLGGPQLWDRDEPRNAACAHEMLERGDWVVPTFNGDLRVLKPIMKYWLMISAYKMFGVNEFAARFWFAFFAVAAVIATYFLGKRLFASDAAGLWSALTLSTSTLFVVTGHLAKADAPLTFFSTVALLIYVYSAFKPAQASFSPTFPLSWPVAVLIYAVLGLAALTKGLPGLLPAAVIGMFLLIVRLPRLENDARQSKGWRRWLGVLRPFAPVHFLRTFWSMRPITGLFVVLAVAGPWYVMVGLRTDGEFLRGFFLEHHWHRALEPMENHRGPFLIYYLVTIIVGSFPWSVLLPALLVWLVSQFRRRDSRCVAHVFALCWLGVYVVIFSCAKTKLPGYIAPCFPALALLMGCFLSQMSAGLEVPPWIRSGLVLLAVIGVVFTLGVTVAARLMMPGEEVLGLIGLILVIGAVVTVALIERQRTHAATVSLGITAVGFCTLVFGVALPRVGRPKAQPLVCSTIYQRCAEPCIGSFGNIEPSWVFYAKRPVQPLTLAEPTPSASRPWKVQPMAAAQFFDQGRARLIITNDEDWQFLRPILPADARVVADAPRTLRAGRWLLIGHAP